MPPGAGAVDDAGELVQRLYLAYFGRPPDAGGLAFFSGAVRAAGPAPALLDSLLAAPEARTLREGTDGEAVVAVYRNLFNRDPDPDGLAWWSGLLAAGTLPRAALPVAVLAGAGGADLAVVQRKLALVRAYGALLADPDAAAAYQGDAALAVLRTTLGQVSAATDDAQIAALAVQARTGVAAAPAFPRVEAIVRARCVACHSEHPTMPGFRTAPRNTRFDTAAQIRADANRIHINVVQTEFMPYGNRTGMTPAERAVIKAWFAAGAQ